MAHTGLALMRGRPRAARGARGRERALKPAGPGLAPAGLAREQSRSACSAPPPVCERGDGMRGACGRRRYSASRAITHYSRPPEDTQYYHNNNQLRRRRDSDDAAGKRRVGGGWGRGWGLPLPAWSASRAARGWMARVSPANKWGGNSGRGREGHGSGEQSYMRRCGRRQRAAAPPSALLRGTRAASPGNVQAAVGGSCGRDLRMVRLAPSRILPPSGLGQPLPFLRESRSFSASLPPETEMRGKPTLASVAWDGAGRSVICVGCRSSRCLPVVPHMPRRFGPCGTVPDVTDGFWAHPIPMEKVKGGMVLGISTMRSKKGSIFSGMSEVKGADLRDKRTELDFFSFSFGLNL